MRKIFFLFIIVLTACNHSPKKTVKIGECVWFPEYGYMDALRKAKKENKPVFVYFTAKWCGPCQMVKKELFEKKEFKKVAKEAILLKIEQTEIPGMALCRKYKIATYPSFRILDKNGKIIDRGWKGWQKGKKVKDVYQLLIAVKDRQNPDYFKKPLPLPKLIQLFTPLNPIRYDMSLKQQFEILYISLMNYSKNQKGVIENPQYNLLLTYLVSYIGKLYNNKENKNYISPTKLKNIKILIEKIKDRKKRNLLTGFYYLDTNQPEKSLKIFRNETKKIKKIVSYDDILPLKYEALSYIELLKKENIKVHREIQSNILANQIKTKILSIANRIINLAYLYQKDEKMYNSVFGCAMNIIEHLRKNGEKEIASKIASNAFDTLIKTSDLSKMGILNKDSKYFESKTFDPHNFWLSVYLDKFTEYKLIPDKILKFDLKHYTDANIITNAQDNMAEQIFKNYFTLGEYKKGMEFMKNFLNDQDFQKRVEKEWFNYRVYGKAAYICVKNNVYLKQAEIWTKKADKLTKHKDEYIIFLLAEINAKKGNYKDAVMLAKEAYEKAYYRQCLDENFVKEVKRKIKKWKSKI